MTKKDYILIAKVLKDNIDGQKEDSHRIVTRANTAIYNIMQGLAEEFRKDNQKFNREKFLKACGLAELINN